MFRSTPEMDHQRGPLLSAYLRFEILLWAAIAILSLLIVLGQSFLPTPSLPDAPDSPPVMVGMLVFSLLAFIILMAVYRFRKWGVYILSLWTLALAVGLGAALFTPPVDLLFLLALAGFIVARTFILLFEIRPKWVYFKGGIF
jgi:hypothetical protein